MGGFAAILFGSYLKANCIISFCPQTVWMSEDASEIDRPYIDFHKNGDISNIRDLKVLRIPENTLIFVGENDWLDVWHAFRLREKSLVCVVPRSDHETLVPTLKEKVNYSSLILALIEGQDEETFCSLIDELVQNGSEAHAHAYYTAMIAQIRGDTKLAYENFEKYLSENSGNRKALIDFGTFCFNNGDLGNARAAFFEAHNLNTVDLLCLHALAQVDTSRKDFESASHWLNKADNIDVMNIWTIRYRQELVKQKLLTAGNNN